MAAGLGFKTFTTGEVLTAADTNGYLMQGVLVFASAAARDAAITSPQEGQFAYLKDTNVTTYYTGSAWTNLDTTGMTNPMTTTGDMVYSSSGSTPARLGIGTTGQVLSVAGGIPSWATASSGSSNVAGKNAVINSAMNVWQRGTSISLAASAGTTFLADRWCTQTGANQATTVSRQATGDTTNLPFIQYAMRFQRNSGQTGTANYAIMSPMETINTVPYAGKTVTLSFYARKGANYSATSDILRGILRTGTGTDQNPFSGYTGDANSLDANFTLTTTWQRFSVSGTIAATVTEMTVQFNYTPTGTAGANDYYDITGIQVEIAASASAYSPNAATFQGELAACQRYYWRQIGKAGNYSIVGNGFGNTSGTQMIVQIKNPVELRTEASSIDSSGLLGFNGNSLTGGLTSVTLDYANQTYSNFKGTVTCDAKAPLALILNIGTTNYIGFSAEL
jgi:hypothetical protein